MPRSRPLVIRLSAEEARELRRRAAKYAVRGRIPLCLNSQAQASLSRVRCTSDSPGTFPPRADHTPH
jgi:hypothetical protein